jgi:valyl-tRNA synthetase
MHHDSIPWQNIVISGHVLSDSKEKLSKSKGQKSMTPDELLAQYPADVIRYWTASGTLGQDIAFSEQQLKIGQRLVTKLWNAFIFTKDHIDAYEPKGSAPVHLGVCNEWILDCATKMFSSYESYFKNNEFSLALNSVEQFFWNDFCDNYLEVIKDQLFNPDLYSKEEVEATRYTLYTIGLRILQLYAPYLPFVTETIYQQLYRKRVSVKSVHQTRFKEVHTASYEASAHTMRHIIEIIGAVRKLKTEQQLSLKADLSTLTIYISDATLQAHIKKHEQLIKGSTRAQSVEYETIGRDTSSLEPDGELWHAYVTITVG